MFGHEHSKQMFEDGTDDGDEEDFYGLLSNANGETRAITGASEKNLNNISKSPKPAQKVSGELAAQQLTPNAEQRKLDMQKKAAELRARLIANRQSTPAKQGLSGASTPSKSQQIPEAKPESDSNQQSTSPKQTAPSSDIFGLESLLAEGKAAAEAKSKDDIEPLPQKEVTLVKDHEVDDVIAGAAEKGIEQIAFTPASDAPTNTNEKVTFPPNLTDDYYADLPIWLEVTGYHDVDYRNFKLRTYKERKALEEEAARIAERLEKLREDEQAEMTSLRSSTMRANTADPKVRPALPSVMPTDGLAQSQPSGRSMSAATKANGTKRAHSPEPIASEKAVRLRGGPNHSDHQRVNTSTITQTSARPLIQTLPTTGLERRISYPEVRRGSADEFKLPAAPKADSRDPSLERRQKFYKHDGQSTTPALNYSKVNRYDRNSHGGYRSNGDFENRGRLGSRTTYRFASGSNYRESPQYGRRASSITGNNGVRYFMIKSWNYENVRAAMEDSLWATQEKNEQILAEAYTTSKSVVLFFSVNKSTAFQGYAVMNSAPDPLLPKPSFCSKLNWSTSPAFTLRWLAKTEVHYRHVGHLKNTMNLDEDGKAMAVLVGKDCQEISPDAGAGLAAVLDDYNAADQPNVKPKRTSSAWSNSLSARW